MLRRLIAILTLVGCFTIISGCAEDVGEDDGDSAGGHTHLLGQPPAEFDADAEYE